MAAAPPQFLSASAALRPKRGMSVIGASVSGSWTKLAIQPPRRRRCPLVAQMRSADRVRKCLLFGVDLTYREHHETDAFDPKQKSPSESSRRWSRHRLAPCAGMCQYAGWRWDSLRRYELPTPAGLTLGAVLSYAFWFHVAPVTRRQLRTARLGMAGEWQPSVAYCRSERVDRQHERRRNGVGAAARACRVPDARAHA
jgi:hypothetical protein